MKISRKKRLPPVANMEAFLAVARALSVTVAAEELFLTQGAVSRQVLDLEKFVGTSLFLRGARGLQLTAAGQSLALKLQPALGQLEEVFASLKTPGRETLNVSVTPSLGVEIITREIHSFLKEHPHFFINFFTRVGDVDFEKEEGLDVAVVSGEPRFKGAQPELLYSPVFYAYIAADLADAGGTGAADDLTVLYRHPLIGQMRHAGAWADYMQRLGLVFSPEMIGANHSMLTTAAQAVLNGSGIALLPEFIAKRHVTAGTMRRVSDKPYHPAHSSYYLVSKKSVREKPIFQAFHGWLKNLGAVLE